MFAGFSSLNVRRENFDDFVLGTSRPQRDDSSRKRFLNNVARLVGSDLYVTATK